MSLEIRGTAGSGTLYARVMNRAGLWWNGAAVEAYSSPDYATYAVVMTQQGTSGVYVADFPAGITEGGTYDYFVHIQAGVTPAEGDVVVNTGKVDWTGTASSTAATGSMSGSAFRDYVLRSGFKRTDKDTELYEATTDAIQEMRARFSFDEAEAESTTTDTISVLGDFKIDIESDMGLLLGVVLEDGDVGTPLERVSKSRFDELYPYINADATFTGYPRHYCVYAGQIYIGNRPDRTSYVYRLTYSKRAGAVTSATAGVPFTALYRKMLADLVKSILYEGLDEFDKSTYFRNAFETDMQTAARRERNNAGLSTFNVQQTNF